jgi:hypothetical protein
MLRWNKKAVGLAILLSAAISGCSNGYLDRRDIVSESSGDAVASNKVMQMVDPWPADSADTRIGFNGQKMQGGMERYRENRVTPPVGTGTASTYQPAQQNNSGNSASNAAPVGQTVTQGVK